MVIQTPALRKEVLTGEILDPEDYTYLELLGRVKKALDTAREVQVDATDIRPFPGQPRKYFNEESVMRLANSIDAGGQTTSGMIREKLAKTRYELIDGERRWRAVLLIPPTRRPDYKAKLIVADDDVVQFLISGVANFNREGHVPLEVMETIKRMVSFKLPMREIANLLGISEGWAGQMYGLRNLGPKVKLLLDPKLPRKEMLPTVAAIRISKLSSEKDQVALAERVISGKLSLGRLRSEVVKVGKASGAHIQERELSPLKNWEGLARKVDVLLRTAEDIEHLLKRQDLSRIAAAHPTETSSHIRSLQKVKDMAERSGAVLIKSKK